jgi:predicted nucleic acid-binding protein
MNAVDTNVLIYACDARDRVLQERALTLLSHLRDAVLPWQVACEFIAASRKLSEQGFTSEHAWARLEEFAALMPLVPPSPHTP